MDEAANIPLPSPVEATVNTQDHPKLPYATSLHSFVGDNQSVNLTDWESPAEQPRRSHSYRPYGDPYDRSNASSRNIVHDDVALQDFPLPATSQAQEGRDTPIPTNQHVDADNISNHDRHFSFDRHEPVEELRRKLADYELPLLQQVNENNNDASYDPVKGDEEQETHQLSYDLIAPYQSEDAPLHSLEKQGDLMFSTAHMLTILSNPRYLFKFREFLTTERPGSLPVLMYYLSACKALKAIEYANAVAQLLMPLSEIEASEEYIPNTRSPKLEQQAQHALQALVTDELPAFITSNCIYLVSHVVEERIKGTLPPKFQGTSDALAEVFCLTDPSRPDNPIIFASEEFHRTTQYGMDYVLGRNCRFLQGPKTNKHSVRRIREALQAGRQIQEVFLNYRRDGSPFMNLLMCAPLCDSKGNVRYFIGAQIDVSGLIMDDARMESMKELARQTASEANGHHNPESATTNGHPMPNGHVNGHVNGHANHNNSEHIQIPTSLSTPQKAGGARNNLMEFAELLSPGELSMIREHGSSLFEPVVPRRDRPYMGHMRPRIMLRQGRTQSRDKINHIGKPPNLPGVYDHYLLVRPYPSLRILFTSPSLRIPGILQTSFFSKVGGSPTVRDELLRAFIDGRSVTARIQWLNRYDSHGRSRWVHCTPLLAHNGGVGVWMVVIVDDDDPAASWRAQQQPILE